MSRMPIGRPRFVSLEEALAWQETAIAAYGGSRGLRDVTLLDSALAQAGQGFGGHYAHEYPFGMAAAYAYHVAKNHPFVDGNKRAALLCCGGFLRMNGWDLVSEGEHAADAILSLAMAIWIRRPSLVGWRSTRVCAPPSNSEIFSVVSIL